MRRLMSVDFNDFKSIDKKSNGGWPIARYLCIALCAHCAVRVHCVAGVHCAVRMHCAVSVHFVSNVHCELDLH